MSKLGLSLSTFVAAGALVACSSSSTDKGANDKTDSGVMSVTVASWWQAPGESEAITALISTFESANPGYRVNFDLIASGDAARTQLAAQLADPTHNPPPDVAQYNANNVPALLSTYPDDALTNLDDQFAAASLTTSNVPQEVLDAVKVNGHIYSIPLNIHRENMLFYNTAVLAANSVSAPASIDDLIAACPKLKTAGVTPVLTSYQGWIQRIMFNSIAAGTMGATQFHDFMTGKTPFTDAAWSAAIDKYTALLEACVDDTQAKDTANYGWSNCADDLYQGKGAFFFHGDWAKGYLVSRGSTPGTDFGGVGSPGAKDLFWFGVDVLILPQHSQDPTGARLFFNAATSIDGQVAFNKLKGSTPFRTDVDATSLDPVGAQTQADFKAPSAVRMLVNAPSAWDTALGEYAVSRDKVALLKAYTDNPVATQ